MLEMCRAQSLIALYSRTRCISSNVFLTTQNTVHLNTHFIFIIHIFYNYICALTTSCTSNCTVDNILTVDNNIQPVDNIF